MKHRFTTLAALTLMAACGEAPTAPTPMDLAPAFSHQAGHNVFKSGAHVDTWNAIVPPQDPNWGTQVCVPQPGVALNDPRWTNPHKAFVGNGAAFRSWTSHIFVEDWINSWPAQSNGVPEWYGLTAQWGGPPGSGQQSWTRYSIPVSGTGTFDLYLAADNCSWIYVTDADGSSPQLVGVQLGAPWIVNIKYPVTLSGDHLLQFLVFDGGGQSGGMFRLETSTTVYADTDGDGLPDVSETNIHLTDPNNPDTDGDGLSDGAEVESGTNPRNTDTDGDGTPDGQDPWPLDPTRGGDTTPPAITASVSGDHNGDWYTSDVTVAWTVTDAESDVIGTSGCAATTVTTDTDGQTFTCEATSEGGTAEKSVTIQRDATGPAISFTGATSYTVDQDVSITCSASDAMSGIATSDCPGAAGAAYTFGVGEHTLSASATDVAGNISGASTSFTVSADAGSLCTLVQRWVSNKGVANSMCQQLRAQAYGAFTNHVKSQSGKKFLSTEHANTLIDLVGRL